MPASDPQAEVLARLRAAWHKERHYVHLRGLCLLLVWFLSLALVSWAIDVLFELPGWARVALIVFDLAVLSWVAYRQWWRKLERYNPVTTALRVERRHPELQSLLVSYVQLGDHGGGGGAGGVVGGQVASTSLLGAMRKQALAATRPIDFREIISYAQLRQVAAVSLIAFIVFGGASINWREHFQVWLNRILNPAANTAYPRNTQLASLTGDVFLPRGGDLELRLRATGRVPADGGTLWVREVTPPPTETPLTANAPASVNPNATPDPEASPWQPLRLIDVVARDDTAGRADRTFAYPFASLQTGFEYYAAVGDATTPIHRVSVVAPPRIADATVTIAYPDYTTASPKRVDSLNVETLVGSTLDWRIATDPAVRDARMLITPSGAPADAQPRIMPLTLTPDGVLLAQIPVDGPFTYRLAWTDARHGFAFSDEARYAVRTRPDGRPTVEITSPRLDAIPIATLQKRVNLRFHAEDDFGLTSAEIVFTRNDPTATPTRVPISLPGDNPAEVDIAWAVQSAVPDLRVGDLITYWVEVRDNFQPRPGSPAAEGATAPPDSLADVTPHTAASTSRTLQFVSVPDYRAYIYEQLERKAADLRAVQHEEAEADRVVDALRNLLGLPAPTPELLEQLEQPNQQEDAP